MVPIGIPGTIVYARIRKNQLRVRNVKSGKEATLDASPPFTTTRLLMGEFSVAHKVVQEALRSVTGNRWFKGAPAVVVHPLEMVEGGLCEVERRLFQEAFIGAGAAKVVVWVGADLSDAQVEAKAGEKQGGRT